jgi:hypothetical protein
MRVVERFLATAFVFLMTTLVCAQEGWKAKPYQQWTKDDSVKTLSDSPWAQVVYADAMAGAATTESQLRAVTIQLRSALPIRQALLRLKQLDAKYDKMNDKQRSDFDAKMRETLACSVCADKYVISLGPPQSSRPVGSGTRSLRDLTLGLLKKRVYIANESGERRELIYFAAPGHGTDEAFFFFPRFDERGRPLLTPENKKLIFFFEAKDLLTPYGRVLIPERSEFNVSRLIVEGKVEF